MSKDKYDEQTVKFYDKNFLKYINWSKKNISFKLEKKFLSLLDETTSIIDVGCGAGHSSVWFSKKVQKVTALDPSIKMTDKIKFLPNINTITASILSVEFHEIFSGAWASFSLQHLEKKDQKKAQRIIYDSLKPHGLFYLGIHKGEHSYRDNLGRLYVPRIKEELESELVEIGFRIWDISIKKSLSFEKKPIEIMHIFCLKN